MKIKGNENNISKIYFSHNGTKLRFQCYVDLLPYRDRLAFENGERVEIIFDDLYEVDNMIEMLTRFKDQCERYMGKWN